MKFLEFVYVHRPFFKTPHRFFPLNEIRMSIIYIQTSNGTDAHWIAPRPVLDEVALLQENHDHRGLLGT